MIQEILTKLDELDIDVYPFGIDEEELKKIKECVIYTYNPSGTSNRFQLEIRIIASSLLRCLEIKENIENLFIGKGDRVNFKKCTSVEFTGGGSLQDRISSNVHLFFYVNFIGKRNGL